MCDNAVIMWLKALDEVAKHVDSEETEDLLPGPLVGQ